MTEKETKDVFIQVRYTPSEKAQIEADAQRLGYDNTSDMVRDAVAYFVKMAERNER
jgi:hypothetical protein